MKISTTILLASTVVIASTIYARPTLLKRVADAVDAAASSAGAVACLVQMTVAPAPTLSSSCQSEFAHDVGLVKGAKLTDLKIDISSAVPTIASTGVDVQLLTAAGLPSIPVSRAKLTVSILEGGQSAGSLASAWLSAKTTDNNLDVELTATTLTVSAEQLPAFKTFLNGISTQFSHAFTLAGTVDVDLSICLSSAAKSVTGPFGAFVPTVPAKTISIPGVGISLPITLGGLNNFEGGEVQSASSSVSAVTNVGGVDTVQFKVAATNPSTITILFGDVDFQVWTFDVTPVLVGIASVTKLNIVPGVSIWNVVLKANAGVSLSTYFPAKDGLKLVVSGFDQSSKFPITAAAASSVKVNLVFKN